MNVKTVRDLFAESATQARGASRRDPRAARTRRSLVSAAIFPKAPSVVSDEPSLRAFGYDFGRGRERQDGATRS